MDAREVSFRINGRLTYFKFQPREEKKVEPLTPEQRSAECFLKALISGELEILGGEQPKWYGPTEQVSAEEMDRLVKKYEEEQALWNSPETPIPPPPTKKKSKKMWWKKVASSESGVKSQLRRTGMDEEFPEIFHAIGWENFWEINEPGSYLLTLEFLSTLVSENGGFASDFSTKSFAALGGILAWLLVFQVVAL